jgi:outer membrane lipoprotein-sorting protein
MIRGRIVTIAILLLLGGCADAWAQSLSRQIARDLERMESYQGVTVEEHLSADGPVRRRVLYARPWRARVETLSPASHAGELFIYDGSQVVMWWPKQRFGVRVRGLATPDRAEIRAHIERFTRASMDAYAFSLRSQSARVAGRTALEWRVTPTRRSPYRHRHQVWNDRRYPMPLRMTFAGDDGAPWYAMAFESIAFDQPIADDAFAFEFPKNAVVFEWDLSQPGLSLAEARERMNFTVKMPGRLPPGHTVEKIVPASHCLPMIAVVMNRGASMLSLTESRDMGLAEPPLGKTVRFGDRTGVLSFLGTFATITWVEDGTLLTLSGNIGYPELLAIAESVE